MLATKSILDYAQSKLKCDWESSFYVAFKWIIFDF